MKSRPLQIFRLTSPPSYSSLVETQQSIYAWNTRVPSIVFSPSPVCLASLPSPFHHLSLFLSLFLPLFFQSIARYPARGAFRSSSFRRRFRPSVRVLERDRVSRHPIAKYGFPLCTIFRLCLAFESDACWENGEQTPLLDRLLVAGPPVAVSRTCRRIPEKLNAPWK